MLSSPVSPDEMDWRTLFPAFYPEKDDKGTCKTTDERSAKVEFADIGCGYGGLLGNLFSIKDAHYNVHVTVLIMFRQLLFGCSSDRLRVSGYSYKCLATANESFFVFAPRGAEICKS